MLKVIHENRQKARGVWLACMVLIRHNSNYVLYWVRSGIILLFIQFTLQLTLSKKETIIWIYIFFKSFELSWWNTLQSLKKIIITPKVNIKYQRPKDVAPFHFVLIFDNPNCFEIWKLTSKCIHTNANFICKHLDKYFDPLEC